MAGDAILVLNAGSSSLKFAVFGPDLQVRLSGAASEIGGAARFKIGGAEAAADLPNHAAAFDAVLAGLAEAGLSVGAFAAAAHRVVHGGATLTAATRLDADALAAIRAAAALAPLHNPPALAVIEAVAARAPELPQCASIDTAFHATNPAVATRYAIHREFHETGIRRYGFHGISYASLAATLPDAGRLLACHLGNGASLCAIRDGRSVATTMGYSPLEGLPMGTRTGDLDPNAVLRLVRARGVDTVHRLLNFESGLKALAGTSDMRTLEAAGTDEARFAIAYFCYWVTRHAGGMIAAMGGLDAIAFTGGIGENSATVRAGVAEGLAWTGLAIDTAANEANAARFETSDSRVAAHIVPAEEERHIAREARDLLA